LDKAEYKIKLDQINKLAEAGDFRGAAGIVDSIDWKHVKSIRTLCMVGEIYEANRRYEDSVRVLKYAYKRSNTSKTVLYRLTELSVKTGNLDDAKKYDEEFEEMSPNDNSRFILKYKIMRAEGASLDDQIAVLQEYKDHEYTERWAYELAKLYKKNNQNDKCIAECDDMILWFSEGKYVMKAMELKMSLVTLTPEQLKKLSAGSRPKTPVYPSAPAASSSAAAPEKAAAPSISSAEAITKMNEAASAAVPLKEPSAENAVSTPNVSPDVRRAFSAGNENNIQDKLADSIRAVFAGIQKPGTESAPSASIDDLDTEENQEEFSDEDVKEYVPAHAEDLSQYKIKSLEPESISGGAVKQSADTAVDTEHQMTLDEVMKPKDKKDLDLDALFAETKSALASEVASGDFEKTDTIIDEKAAAEKEAAEKAAAEAAKAAVPVMAAAPAAAPAAEAVQTAAPAAVPVTTAAPAAEAAPVPEEAADNETDESLGLTREFNFHEELQKAMGTGETLSEAAKKVSAKAEEEAASAKEETKPTPYVNGDTQEIPPELFADKEDLADVKEENLADLSSEGDETQVPEQSKSIVEEIMEKPETIHKIDVAPRAFDETEKKIFSYFAPIPGMAQQITQAIADVHNNAGDKTSRSGNILLIGRQGSGKTHLADSIILSVCKDLNIKAAKTAHIVATDFNQKDPAKIVAKMSGGFLVIEGAGELNDESIDRLSQAMEFRTDDLVVILEDEKTDLRAMLETHPQLGEKFTSVITIPVFTNDELVTFAKTYTKERGYKMDEMGVLALYTMIGDNQKDAEPVTVGKVKDMVDTAISRAEKGSRKFGRKFSKNAMDEDGRIILHEKDFDF
jgi:tetratricopeptide (TPR) repeat protein